MKFQQELAGNFWSNFFSGEYNWTESGTQYFFNTFENKNLYEILYLYLWNAYTIANVIISYNCLLFARSNCFSRFLSILKVPRIWYYIWNISFIFRNIKKILDGRRLYLRLISFSFTLFSIKIIFHRDVHLPIYPKKDLY